MFKKLLLDAKRLQVSLHRDPLSGSVAVHICSGQVDHATLQSVKCGFCNWNLVCEPCQRPTDEYRIQSAQGPDRKAPWTNPRTPAHSNSMSGRSNRSGHRGRGRPGRGHAHANAHVEAAAAQQAEQQLLAAAFNPAPRHTYSSDDEEDEDFAEFKKQAAQLAGQAKPQPVLPEGLELSKFAAAVQQLQEHGISKEAATDALLASAEQHWQDFDT